MIRANFISTKGAWHATPADSIVLDHEGRHRRRVAMTATRGTEFLLDLPEAVALRGGDALILEDGRLIEIIAAPEALAEVRCNDPRQLARVAYHIGNRHAQAEILANRVRVRRDHVLEDMVRGLGAKVAHIEAPFEPDTGAYEAPEDAHVHKTHDHKGHAHKHDAHGHDHGHDHAHDHGHKHGDHKHDGDHAHVHDESCGCDDEHAHEQKHAHGDHDHKHDHKAPDHKAHNQDHAHGTHGHKHD